MSTFFKKQKLKVKEELLLREWKNEHTDTQLKTECASTKENRKELKAYVMTLTNGHCTPILYADDANLIITAENISDLTNKAEIILKNVISFPTNLNLKCNVDKTNCFLFQLKNTKNASHCSLNIDSLKVTENLSAKFLGIIVDKNLNWTEQTEHIVNKLRIGNYFLKQTPQCLSLDCLLKIYYAFIFSHLSYGTLVWGNSSNVKITKIFRLQKQSIRIMLGLNYGESCKGLFKKHLELEAQMTIT